MDTANQIAYDFSPYLVVYKDGRVNRLVGTDFVPPSLDSTSVSSKDLEILADVNVSARLYLPKIADPSSKKLPILVHFHGGGFLIGTPFCTPYHTFLTSLVSEAHVIAVSIHYRRAPENPLPTAYEDSWAALKWVMAQSSASGSEPWLAQHGAFDRIVLAGDSAGANIAHNLLMRAGNSELRELGHKIYGGILIHPYFCGPDPIGNEILDPGMKAVGDGMWMYACPNTSGLDDPRINPTGIGAPSLAGLGCGRVMVCVAEKDVWRDRGCVYFKALCGSGWDGVGEMMESKGEDHVFFLLKPGCGNAEKMMSRLAAWINFESGGSGLCDL
ncbi:hypothetical protein AAC387_Pa04g2784 [Persea americana]